MSARRTFDRGAARRAALLVLVIASAAGTFAACSLNPQPIPPGEQPDGAFGSYRGEDGAASPNDQTGAGGGSGSDAGASDAAPLPPPSDGGVDATTGVPEGGAPDASDAALDAPDARDR